MARPGVQGTERNERLLPGGLWTAAGLTLLLGIFLRLAGGIFASGNVRLAGVLALGIGVLLAVLGWLGDKLRGNRRPD